MVVKSQNPLYISKIVWFISIAYPVVVYITYKNESAYEKLRYYFLHVVVMITFLVLLLTCSSIIMCKNRPEMPIIRYHSEDSSTDQADEETFAKCKRIAARMSDSSILLESLKRRFSSKFQRCRIIDKFFQLNIELGYVKQYNSITFKYQSSKLNQRVKILIVI